jgi:Protein of unknown function (DUF3034)
LIGDAFSFTDYGSVSTTASGDLMVFKATLKIMAVAAIALTSLSAQAQDLIGGNKNLGGGKLLATGGVSQVEGGAGGGLTPWAVIGGYSTQDQVGANAFLTKVYSDDYQLTVVGGLIGLYDRFELSFAQQEFDTKTVGAALGIGKGFKFRQDIFGAKVRLFGDAILDQDTWIPQVAVGLQYKNNNRDDLLKAIGANKGNGTDFYVSATKLFLGQSLLVNGTVRFTKGNELGILGFGGPDSDEYEPMFEGSVGYLLSRNWLVGAEYRSKPDNLAIVKEDDWFDVFVAWVPTKNVSFTLAYANLGTVAIRDKQDAVYLSVQAGF